MRTDVSQLKLNTNMAQAEAEEASTQVGMAHAASEEAANLVAELKLKTGELEAAMVKREAIEEMVQAALVKAKTTVDDTPRNSAYQTNMQMDKFSRTVVVGGFEEDSLKADVVEALNKGVAKHVQGIEEVYAYRRGSIAFIRFRTVDLMWNFLKKVNARGVDKPVHNGRKLWQANY